MNPRKNKYLKSLWLTEEESKRLNNLLSKVVLYEEDLKKIADLIVQVNIRGDFKNG